MFVALIIALALTACGTGGGAGATEVTVNMTEFSYDMSQTEFQTGTPYHFIVTNNGALPHDFIIMAVTEGEQVSSLSPEEKQARAFLIITEDELQPGETVETDYTFTGIPEGNIEVVCTVPGHFEAGMRRPITIR
jgi:uncharacterized cupredoxin-like copper-binding protein